MSTIAEQTIQEIEQDAQQRIRRIRQAEAEAAKVREENRLSAEQKAAQEAEAEVRRQSAAEWAETHVPALQEQYAALCAEANGIADMVAWIEQSIASIVETYPDVYRRFFAFGEVIVKSRMGQKDADSGLIDREFAASDAIGDIVGNGMTVFLPSWLHHAVRNRHGNVAAQRISSEDFYSELDKQVRRK